MSDATTAETIEWTATSSSGGANFRTHNLVEAGPRKLEFKLTTGARAFMLAFPGFGVIGLIIAGVSFGRLPWWATAIAASGGLLFIGAGTWYLRRMSHPIIFDGATREFTARAGKVRFDSVCAIQFLDHVVKMAGNDGSYTSFEINLVGTDGTRTHIVGHGDADTLYNDAERIGQLLDVPVWTRG